MIKLNKTLLAGSLVLLVGANLFNIINFFFQFMMARMLTPSDYGILAALFSIIYIIGIFSEPVQTIIAKYSARESQNGKLKNLTLRAFKRGMQLSSAIFVAYLLLSLLLSPLLNIPYLLMGTTGLIIFSAFFLPVTRGLMQGRKLFKALGINLFLEGLAKLALALSFVLIGWKVYGAMAATVLSTLIAFAFSLISLRQILKSTEKRTDLRGIYSYSWPVFIVLLSILAFFSLDVIIARIVFTDVLAGYYAISSVLAKTIFLATQPISKALFPLSAEKKAEEGHPLLINAIGILLVCIVLVLALFFFFPELLIKLFAGRVIPESQSILFYLALAMGIFSLTNLILLYKLSISKLKNNFVFLVFPAIGAVLLFFFHHSLVEYSVALITASAIFLWGSVMLLDR